MGCRRWKKGRHVTQWRISSIMEAVRSSRRPRRSRDGNRPGTAQRPLLRLRNSLKPVELLSRDQLMAIHDASLRLLEQIGIEFVGAAARRTFREAGAEVDDASGLVRIPRELVESAL